MVCLLFYFLKELPGRSNIVWSKDRLISHQIFEYLHSLGNMKAQYEALIAFFAVFQKRMQEQERIPKSIVEKYRDDVTFLVKIDEYWSCPQKDIKVMKNPNLGIRHSSR